MKIFIVLLSLLTGSLSVAGGIYCKQCPGESSYCAPRPDCAQNTVKTFNCQFEGAKDHFQIVENSPQNGLATILPAYPGTRPLRFTQTTETYPTRLGRITVTKKVYFHPYYEFQIFLTSGADYALPHIENLKGVYIAEMQSSKTFRCEAEK